MSSRVVFIFSLPFTFIYISIIFFTGISCSPDDGFCDENKYKSESDTNFICEEMEEHWDVYANDLVNEFSGKQLIYFKSVKTSGEVFIGTGEQITDKPEYLPYSVKIHQLASCVIAAEQDGESCNEWLSLNFNTDKNADSLIFSSRDGENSNAYLKLMYVKLNLSAVSLHGTIDEKIIVFEETSEVDGESVRFEHTYQFK